MPEPIGTNVYDVGDGVTTKVTFKVGSQVTDPTTVTLSYKKPDTTVVTLTYGTDISLVKDSTGVYHTVIPVDSAGTWWYRWVGTGSARGALERMFQVRPSEF